MGDTVGRWGDRERGDRERDEMYREMGGREMEDRKMGDRERVDWERGDEMSAVGDSWDLFLKYICTYLVLDCTVSRLYSI